MGTPAFQAVTKQNQKGRPKLGHQGRSYLGHLKEPQFRAPIKKEKSLKRKTLSILSGLPNFFSGEKIGI